MVFRNQGLGTSYAHCYWVCLSSRHTQWTDLKIYVCTVNHIYTHIYIYSVTICKNILKTTGSYWWLQFQFNTTGFILAFSYSLFVTFFSNHKKCGFNYLQYVLLICAILVYPKSSLRIANPYCHEEKIITNRKTACAYNSFGLLL